MTPRPGSRLALALVVLATFVALLGVIGATLSLVVARAVVTPPRRRTEDIRVLAIDRAANTVTLTATHDSRLPGKYSYFFSGDTGSAQVGAIVATTADSITRDIIAVPVGKLVVGVRGRFSGWFYSDPSELGVPFQNVLLETELGPAPAWLVPVAGDLKPHQATRWVIQVHGRAVRRQETLRAVEVFRAAGFTSLLVSYRNDGDAPASADGRYALGDTEWRDVDVALRYAIANGATDVVLMGWSMGGATVLQELTRSPEADVIRGIVLDSPVVDWVTALRFQGDLRRLPSPVSAGAMAIIGARWGRPLTGQGVSIDLPRLDFVTRAHDLHVPILILHSNDDRFVPITASRALAAARPDIVTFEAFSVAAHTKLWNFDPVRWTAAISEWLERVELSSGRS